MRRQTLSAAAFWIALALQSAGTLDAAVKIATPSLAPGLVGRPYSAMLDANGGKTPYIWSLFSGALPPGLSLSADGAIAGTPTSAGVFTSVVRVTDANQDTDTQALAITVTVPPPLSITTASLPDGVVNRRYTQTLTAQGGTGSYQWSVSGGSLPSGLLLDGARGVIDGTPGSAGRADFTVTVSDGTTTATKAFSITVAAALSITTTSLPPGTAGTPYSQSLAAAGGLPPYTWTTSGNLPAGLSLSGSTISGTPTAAGAATFNVQVADSAGNTATGQLSITINPAPLQITTSALPAGTVGVSYSQALAASGGTPPYTWTATGLPAGLSVSGSAISGTPTAAGAASFTLQVADATGNNTTRQLSVTINPAPLQITTTALPAGTVGVPYSQALAASGGTPPYTWTASGLPAGLAVSGATIGGTPSAAGTARVTVRVSDGKATVTSELSLTIHPPALQITTTSLPEATANAPYQQSLAATGGTPPYTWAVNGALPPGISLAGSTISGTPLAPGIARFSVQVTDADKNSATQQLSITVRAAALQITTGSLPAATVGVPYSQLLTATGGTTPYAWTAVGDLPPGLTLAGSAISGTPSASGSFSFTIQVADAASQRTSVALTLTVNASLTIVTASLADAVVGVAYSQQLTGSGGSPPYSWSLASGSLPAGITLDPASGAVGGTPGAAGNASFTVRLTDSSGAQANRAFTIATAAGLSITNAPVLPAGTAGAAYAQTIVAVGGRPPYTWSITAGALPGGLLLDAAGGALTGKPTASGDFPFTVEVRDSAGATATKAFRITIAAALLISSAPNLPDGNAGSSYSQPLSAAGGAPPYSWSIVSGSLPAGLQLDSATGMIAGTPAAAETFSFTAQVTDSVSATASKQFSVRILAGLAVVSATLGNAVLGSPYTQPLAASGGVPPYLWSITAGALPAGLSLDPATGTISGAPSANGNFPFTVQVSDNSGLTAAREQVLVVIPATVPSVSIDGGADVMDPLQQPSIAIALGAPYPAQITGRLTLSFVSDAVAPDDDPAIQFATGGRSVAFTIPANTTSASFSIPSMAIQTGSVAGTITLRVALAAGDADITPAGGAAIRTIRVNRAEPKIRAATGTRSSSGLQLTITGFSTSRELASARVTFTPSPGGNLQTTELSVPLTDFAAKWFQDPLGMQFGSQFTLVLPFTVQGDASAIASATVTLANQTGASAPVTVTF